MELFRNGSRCFIFLLQFCDLCCKTFNLFSSSAMSKNSPDIIIWIMKFDHGYLHTANIYMYFCYQVCLHCDWISIGKTGRQNWKTSSCISGTRKLYGTLLRDFYNTYWKGHIKGGYQLRCNGQTIFSNGLITVKDLLKRLHKLLWNFYTAVLVFPEYFNIWLPNKTPASDKSNDGEKGSSCFMLFLVKRQVTLSENKGKW